MLLVILMCDHTMRNIRSLLFMLTIVGVAGFFPSNQANCCLQRRLLLLKTTTPWRNHVVRNMAIKVNIRIVGRKQSERWIEDGCEMYETRIRTNGVNVETTWHKDNAALIKNVETDWTKKVPVVMLDPLGKTMTSEKFTDTFYRWIQDGGSRLVLVIGGADGLPSELRNNGAAILLSLSNLTFTHQFARLVLMEQLYRASEIRKGSSYHK